MNKLPTVVFEQMPIKLETEMFFEFLNMDYWAKRITNKYPQFLQIKEINEKKEKISKIKSEIIKIRKESRDKLNINLKAIKNDWQKVEGEVLEALSEIIQTDWSNREITTYISINPVCPRFLNTWSFSVSSDYENTNLVIAHEISHFLYFKKFKEQFHKAKKENYESPHKEWLLSEIVAVIMSHDPRILKLIKTKSDYYPDHKTLKVKGEFVTKIIEDLYKNLVIKNNNFSEFIKRGLEVVKSIN